MAKFIYKAKRGLSEVVEGIIEAETQEDVLDVLAARGVYPLSVEQDAAGLSSKGSPIAEKKNKILYFLKKNRVTSKDRLLFTNKLTTLIKSRVELLSAIKILYDQAEDGYLKNFISQMYCSIKEGKPFSEALQKFPKCFNLFYVSMIKAGEASGRIDLSLEQISDYLGRQERLKSRIKLALAYPLLLAFIGCVSIFILINFVIPKLRVVLEGSGAQLPLLTKVVLSISELSQQTSFIFLPAIIIAVIFLVLYKDAYLLRLFLEKLKTRLPVVKDIFANQELASFSWVLSLLIKSGVPIYQSFQIASNNIENSELVSQLGHVCERLRNGDPLAKSMEVSTKLPSFFVKMVGIGEESGRLSEILGEISQSYTQEVESSIALISSLLEPILILVLGSVLGLVVFSIMMPIFEVTQVIK